MAVRLRLARTGTKKRPHYRIVAAESRSPRDGRYIEQIGTYHPLLPKDHERRIRLDLEKANEWIGKGAQPTDRVARMLEAAGALPARERNNPERARPKKKAQERAAALAAEGADGAEASA